jgi:hypothetical protein
MHIYAAGLVLANSAEYEHGARLAEACGLVFVIGVIGPALARRLSPRYEERTPNYHARMQAMRLVGWICLPLAVAGLVMMAIGSAT